MTDDPLTWLREHAPEDVALIGDFQAVLLVPYRHGATHAAAEALCARLRSLLEENARLRKDRDAMEKALVRLRRFGEASMSPDPRAREELAFQLWLRFEKHSGWAPEMVRRLDWPSYNADYYRKHAAEIIAAALSSPPAAEPSAIQSLMALTNLPSAAPQPAPEPPQWGEPARFYDGRWKIVAKCFCEVLLRDGTSEGSCCRRHTLADLVSGEARLRSAIEHGARA